ncbi:MAG: hypothetical protein DCF27_05620 [Lysobacteraceae bacterium]|nr:MAG: hypothetical protein DCF27_05620 [Xanthomonadaceae bacterium]
MSGLLTTWEHQTLGIGSGVRELSPAEVDILVAIGQSRPGFCTLGHRNIRLAQFAGLVNLGGRVLEILPKVESAVSASSARGTFLRLLHAAKRVPIHSLGSVGHAAERRSLLGIFIDAFLDEASRLVRGGLLRRYQSRKEDVRVVRGRLLVTRQAAVHGMRPDLVACAFDELSVDNPRNRVLRAALAVVRPWMEDTEQGRRWLELNAAFDGVALQRDALALLDDLVADRQTVRYEPATRWAVLILKLLSPNVRSGLQAAPEMLFDMNRLFEAAVASVLGERARRVGIAPLGQDTTQFLAECDQTAVFGLRPDLVFRDGDRVVAVADTKWTRIFPGRTTRLEPEQSHAYQMNAYASAFACDDFYLIYPWHADVETIQPSTFLVKQRSGPPFRLHVVCVDVAQDGFPVRHGRMHWLDGGP